MVSSTSSSTTKLTLANWLALVVAIALIVAIGWGVWTGLSALAPVSHRWLEAFAQLPPALSAAIVAGLVSIIVSPLTVTLTKWWERKWLLEQEHRASKRPVYEEFMAFWFTVLGAQRPGGKPVTPEEVVTSLNTFTEKLVVWGSANVIRSYATFRQKATLAASLQELAATSGDAPHAQLLAHTAQVDALTGFENLLFSIRADLGHSPKGLKQRDLLRLFVNDLDESLDAKTEE